MASPEQLYVSLGGFAMGGWVALNSSHLLFVVCIADREQLLSHKSRTCELLLCAIRVVHVIKV